MANHQEVLSSYLQRYANIINQGLTGSDDYFTVAWKIATGEISASRLADEFRITESLVRRYADGKSQPVKSVKPVMLERLAEILSSE